MDPARVRVDQGGQRVHVGRLDLGHLAELQDSIEHLVGLGVDPLHLAGVQPLFQALQRRRVGGVSGLGAPRLGEAQLLEQHLAKLLRRADIELVTHEFVHSQLDGGQLLSQLSCHLLQLPAVQRNAVVLHPHQHRRQPHLDLVELCPVFVLLQLLFEPDSEPVGVVRRRGRIPCGCLDGHLGHGDTLAARAGKVGQRRQLLIEEFQGQRLQLRGFPVEVGRQRRVEGDGALLDPVVAQHGKGIVGVVGRLRDVLVGQQRPKLRQGRLHRQLPALRVAQGEVPGQAGLGGEGHPHELGVQGVLRRAQDVEGEGARGGERSRHLFQGVLGSYHPISSLWAPGLVLRRIRFRRPAWDPWDDAVKLQLPEELHHLRAVVGSVPGRLQVELDGHVPYDGGQLPALEGGLPVLLERPVQPRLRDLVQVLVYPLEAAVLAYQSDGGLGAYAGQSRNIVRRVSL